MPLIPYMNNFSLHHALSYLAWVLFWWASQMAWLVKNLPAVPETWVRPLGQEDPLKKGMTSHSSILAWRIPWTEETGGLKCIVSLRVAQLSNSHFYFSRATITQYHRLGGLNNRNSFSHHSKGQKIKVKVFLLRSLSLICRRLPSCLVTWWSSVYMHLWYVLVCPNFLFWDERQSGWIRAHFHGFTSP